MARYHVLARTFINEALHEPGDIVDYDGQAGTSLQAVDTDSKTEIPKDWREQNGLKRIALARSLGAPKQRMSAAEADLWISNELKNREGKVKPAAKPVPSPVQGRPVPPQPEVNTSTDPNAHTDAPKAGA